METKNIVASSDDEIKDGSQNVECDQSEQIGTEENVKEISSANHTSVSSCKISSNLLDADDTVNKETGKEGTHGVETEQGLCAKQENCDSKVVCGTEESSTADTACIGPPTTELVGDKNDVEIENKLEVDTHSDLMESQPNTCTVGKEENKEVVVHEASREESVTVSDRLLEMIDGIEKRVEHIRKQCSELASEKICLLELLSSLQQSQELGDLPDASKQDISAICDRLIYRCLTVDISVTTPRNPQQEEAVNCVERAILDLATELSKCTESSQATSSHSPKLSMICDSIRSCLNACSSEEDVKGIDSNFQSLVIACAVEDQKKARKRLQGLLLEARMKMEAPKKS